MVALNFFLKNALMPHRHQFPDDCEICVGRGDVPGELTVTGSEARFEVRAGLASLSRDHARFVVAGGRVTVEDLGSRNGTLVRLEPGATHAVEKLPVWLGGDLVVRVEEPRWSLPESLEALSPAALCDYLRAQLDARRVRVELTTPGPESYRLDGESRHLAVRPAAAHHTVSADEVAWVQWVVNAWNAASNARRTGPPWRFVAVSESRRRVLDQARRAAHASLPVLILGPTGCGKDVLAQDIHEHGPHAAGAFVGVNCAGLTPERLESELFGHVRGAYTGAHADAPGLVELASGGTLFLDEVGDMPPVVQGKLLRFLESESGEYRRMGEARTRRAQVRVIAATHRDLIAEVGAERFRQDLFFRLAGIRLSVPRPEPRDVEAIALALLSAAAQRAGAALSHDDAARLAADAAQREWPGGARELRQCVERCVQLRDPALSWRENWRAAVVHQDVGRVAAPGLQQAVVPPATLGRMVADLVFLAAARDAPGRGELARRLRMTYQGADARLDALGVEVGDARGIEQRLARCAAEVRAHVTSDPGLAALLRSVLDGEA